MILRYSTTSPYVRKVSIVIIESGLQSSVQNVFTNPWDPGTDLPESNPIGKVPALITDSGLAIFDSPVICEYLDSLGEKEFFPADSKERWTALRQQAIGDGILDAAVGRIIEGKKPAEFQYQPTLDRYQSVISRSLDTLEREVADLAGDLTIGHITVGCVLGYLDFRFASEDWRVSRKQLKEWYDEISSRPSFQQTEPHD